MIVAIADDFTGAAEIAGIGLRYGLTVEIESNIISSTNADLLVIATDTRSLIVEEAVKEIRNICNKIRELDYSWIFKKIDSVFRGHINAEIKTILDSLSINKSLIVPANPSLGRIIKNGIYYIKGKPLHKTNFANDPDYNLDNSNVLNLSGIGNSGRVLKISQKLENGNIFIGEAEDYDDIKSWTDLIDPNVLPAGAADFFSSLLERDGFINCQNVGVGSPPLGETKLFVCGSSYSASMDLVLNNFKSQSNIFPMPYEVFNNLPGNEEFYNTWKNNICKGLQEANFAIVEINQPVVKNKIFSNRLRGVIAQIIDDILEEIEINELFISGGATVASIVRKSGLNNFYPVEELAQGVLRSRVDKKKFFITIKPGSYPWSKSLL